jgi:lycopene beta-cyclase
VDCIEDAEDAARVTVGDRVYAGRWAFDSLLRPAELKPDGPRYRYLKQHFTGWEIETQRDAFDPSTPTLFDFRTPQNGSMRFVYTLPLSEQRALIEYTLFSAGLLKREEYERGLREHIESRLGIAEYRIIGEENGVIPMTDRPFPRRAGRRVMTIGTRGGRVKPSTGYAFLRVQRDSAAIVQSLLTHGHPFGVPRDSAWYRLHDAIMLEVMARDGGRMARIFTDLFKNNPIERVFRFLDESGSIRNDLRLLASLPPGPFLRALFRSKVLRRISPPSAQRVDAPPQSSHRTRIETSRTGSSRRTFEDDRAG